MMAIDARRIGLELAGWKLGRWRKFTFGDQIDQ
jgi:hypothetical protein